MASKALPCPTLLRLLLDYEPDTGKLFWKDRKPWMFGADGVRPQDKSCAIWNGKNAGKEAFTATTNGGYRVGWLFGVKSYSHRVSFAICNGVWPSFIDHIDGNRSNNQIANLRVVSRTDNARNLAISARNRSGCVGVYLDRRSGLWLAEIRHGGNKIRLGSFLDFDEAVSARKLAEVKYGYHPNHGRKSPRTRHAENDGHPGQRPDRA